MLRELVSGWPALHACFVQPDEDDDADDDGAGRPRIADLVYPQPVFSSEERSAQQRALNATEIAQPALGMVSLAALDVLAGFGLRPDVVAGHSYGEYVALCAAGVIGRDDLVRVSLARGRLSAAAPAGAMAALDVDDAVAVAAIARHGLALAPANLNAPDQTVVAGSEDAIAAAQAALARDGVRVRRLAVGTAFHCAAMAPVGAALAERLAGMAFAAPRIPVYSNLTAAPYPSEGGQIRTLLARHIAEPVRFADEIEALYAAGARVFIECGPGLALTGLTARILGARPHTTLALDAPDRDGWVQLAQLLAQAVAAGLLVDLAPWFAGRGLAEQGVDAVFADERRRGEHGPLVWRVNGGRAAPWTQRAPAVPAPESAPESAPVSAPVAAAAPPPASMPTDESIHHRRTSMSTEELVPDGVPRPAVEAAGPASAAELQQIQDGLARLLAFQCEQQHSLRHFVDFQARLAGIGGAQATAPVPAPARPHLAAPAPVLPVPMAAPIAPVPPTVLPIAAVAPIAATSAPPRKPVVAPVVPALFAHAPGPAPVHAGHGAAAAANSAAPASVAVFSSDLLQAVSARTGYPVDMLDLDAHMEADLGIDSIKRIEIFSGLTQRHSLVGERDEEKMIEELSGFKTLREVVSWYGQLLQPAPVEGLAQAGGASPKKASTPLSPPVEEVESALPDPVRSYVVEARPAEATADTASAWPPGTTVVLVGAPSALAAALHERLAARGCTVRQLVPGAFTRAVDAWRFEVDLSSLESVQPLARLLAGEEQPLGALVNLMGHDGAGASDHRNDARALFLLLKVLGPALRRGAAAGAGRLVNLTAFDGRFGLGGPSALGVGSAGTLGVAKSAAREWSAVRVKCIDAAPGLEPAWLAERVVDEMAGSDGEVEVGFSAEGRCRIALAPRPLERGAVPDLVLDAGAVVLVTGGAYGITADLARLLAENYRPHLVLVGRSALPADEDEATRAIVDQAELRRSLTAGLRAAQEKVTPVQVEAALNGILKERQIRANLEALREAGSTLEYHRLDVRDGAALGALVDDVYARLGRIDGVLHGAGVIGDKLIATKPLAAFDAVYDTKVVPALVLAARLRMPGLRFFAFLSSVAGRFGNIGQADYSAANEVLNKLAGQLSHAWPQLHAFAINWGPWDAGMVNDDLRRLYATRAIRTIAPAIGRRHFLDELELGPQRQAEIVVSSSIGQIASLRLAQ